MLERSLDAGVRLSLRQKCSFLKSRRLLHSSFWSTTAPDVDYIYHLSQPTKLPASASTSPDFPDVSFLDFLYPPSTQAFMTRLPQWEKWSRRNTPPSASRGYSSMAPTQDQSPSPASKDLRNLLDELQPFDSTQPPSLHDMERVWFLSSQVARSDPDLLSRAIILSSKIDDKSAHMHALSLFDLLPERHASPPTFSAAILCNLRLDQVSTAIALHRRASKFAFNGPIGTNLLLPRLVYGKRWHKALSVFKDWETYTASAPSPSDVPHLWALRTTDLKSLGSSLHHLRAAILTRTPDPGTLKFSMFREDSLRLYGALLSHLVAASSKDPTFLTSKAPGQHTRQRLYNELQSAHDEGLGSARLYQDLLSTLCTLNRGTVSTGSTPVIVFIYRLYRKSDFFAPSQELLLKLLKYWMDYHLAYADEESGGSFISKNEILQDWSEHHQKPSDDACLIIMDTFARLGMVEAVHEHAALYKSLHSDEPLNANYLWPLIYVHATLAQPERAAEQLDRLEEDFGVSPNLRCWNIVLHAYEQANDLVGAAELFQKLLDAGLQPDDYTYGSLLNLYAKRGDLDGIVDLLNHAKSSGVTKMTTHMLNSMIVALASNFDTQGAQKALDQTVQAVKANLAEGPLTLCFNTLLVAYGSKRDLAATMATYNSMKDANVPLDARSYAALMQVLCYFRQSQSAHKILRKVMPSNNIRAEAFHYSIVMAGYMNQEMYDSALRAFDEMRKANIRPTASSRAIGLKAKALHAHVNNRRAEDGSVNTLPLDLAIKDYKRLLADTRVHVQGKQPSSGSPDLEVQDVSFLLYIHGRRRSFDAVQHLFELYQKRVTQIDPDRAPVMRLLTTLMFVHFQAGDYVEVDKYWELIRTRAERIRLAHVSAAELTGSGNGNDHTKGSNGIVQIPPSYRFMLSRPLEYYMLSQFAQSPSSNLVPLITELLSYGYVLDNKFWNKYIVQLCRLNPPRTLLAFSLVEKYMMKDWPGWIGPYHALVRYPDKKKPQRSSRKEGLTFIQIRYLYPGQLVPQYRTMVYMASALLELRGLATDGLRKMQKELGMSMHELKKQVGSIPEVREMAPSALHAVQSMPRVVDRLQLSLLGDA